MKFNIKAFALTGGIFWGAIVGIMTLCAMCCGYGAEFVNAIAAIYKWGYSASPLGVITGIVYGFLDGAIGCGVFAWLYNKLAKK